MLNLVHSKVIPTCKGVDPPSSILLLTTENTSHSLGQMKHKLPTIMHDKINNLA